MDILVSALDWIGTNESVLSGIAAAIVILGVVLTFGRAAGARLRRRQPPSGAGPAPAAGSASPSPPPLIEDRPSIAVLPFANLSEDREHAFLADALSEEIILGLSRVKQFFVIARNSSFTYKGRAVDSQQVSRELGVRYVLEGSVRRHGDRVRITAQLVDATSRRTAWAERFDRPLQEIVDVDDEVTEAIVAALQPALRRAEADLARRAAPEDLTAWGLVNRAWVAVQSDLGSREAAEGAVRACEEALRRDPDYALGHAVLAHAQSLLAREGLLDASLADASIRRARRLADDDPLIHHCEAAVHGNLGRSAEGVRAWERSLALDPNSAAARAGLGIARIYQGDPERALGDIDQALRLSPRDPLTYHWLANRALAAALVDRWEAALADAQGSVQRTGGQVGFAVLAAASARAGRLDEARAAYAELCRRAPGFTPEGFERLIAGLHPEAALGRGLVEGMRLAARAAAAPGS